MTVKEKIIVVTGAAQGLGAAISKTLAKDGALVLLTDVKNENLTALEKEIKKEGGRCAAYSLDVSDEKNAAAVIDKIIQEFGRIDAVINNAGIDFTLSVEELSYEQFRKVINVNLIGPFNLSKAVYPHMKRTRSGHIINIASTAAKRAWPNASAYHASKWGLLGFSHALHSEARKDGIKVTAVVAGGMKTPFILDRFPEAESNLQDPIHVAETIKYILCQPEETVIPEVMVIPMKETSWP